MKPVAHCCGSRPRRRVWLQTDRQVSLSKMLPLFSSPSWADRDFEGEEEKEKVNQ